MRLETRLPYALLAATLLGSAPASAGAQPEAARVSAPALRQGMRELWSDHVIWTRSYIVAAVADDASARAASGRLLKNQEDIGNAIVPYYGRAAGDRLAELLKQHILIAVDVVGAAKAGDKPKLADADKRWHDNATQIATFLSGANPNWPRQTLATMLDEHLALTTQEAVARLEKRWDDDVATFDKIHTQILTMADALADGIAKQFPNRVTRG
jgi:hypothetical protein